MKKNLKIIFLLLAVVGILVIALLLIFCNVSLADVSLDTFIGVMVTMIGILVILEDFYNHFISKQF